MSGLSKMTFFERFEADILAGKKTITLRDESEKDFVIGSIVDVATFETDRQFCQLRILAVTAVGFSELNHQHAEQENMSLEQLKQVIADIYPGIEQLYEIQFELIKGLASHSLNG